MCLKVTDRKQGLGSFCSLLIIFRAGKQDTCAAHLFHPWNGDFKDAWYIQAPITEFNTALTRSRDLAQYSLSSEQRLIQDLARPVGDYSQLIANEMDGIIREVFRAVNEWKTVASRIGIPRSEIEIMEPAFYQLARF